MIQSARSSHCVHIYRIKSRVKRAGVREKQSSPPLIFVILFKERLALNYGSVDHSSVGCFSTLASRRLRFFCKREKDREAMSFDLFHAFPPASLLITTWLESQIVLDCFSSW